MSFTVGLRKEDSLRWTAMSERELRRAGVMARVQAGELKVVDAESWWG